MSEIDLVDLNSIASIDYMNHKMACWIDLSGSATSMEKLLLNNIVYMVIETIIINEL